MLYSNQLYSLENEDEYTLYAFAEILDLSNKGMNMDLYLIIYISWLFRSRREVCPYCNVKYFSLNSAL